MPGSSRTLISRELVRISVEEIQGFQNRRPQAVFAHAVVHEMQQRVAGQARAILVYHPADTLFGNSDEYYTELTAPHA